MHTTPGPNPITQAERDCMRRGSRHPEYAWLHWARELPRQFVPAGYRSSLPPDWVHWLAFRLNQTCPGCGTPVCRPRRKGPAATGRGGGPHGPRERAKKRLRR